ncbi:MAG: hypothetical protein KAS32_06495 [Candidatus Peribacteraceae bacterium]|nr:hypothetical protein [Candidatus Peribacteraceae bacterium]
MASVEGKKVSVGDYVSFKCDIEQSGKIAKINGSTLTLTNENGFDGGYIGGDTETEVDTDDCWIE